MLQLMQLIDVHHNQQNIFSLCLLSNDKTFVVIKLTINKLKLKLNWTEQFGTKRKDIIHKLENEKHGKIAKKHFVSKLKRLENQIEDRTSKIAHENALKFKNELQSNNMGNNKQNNQIHEKNDIQLS